MKDDNTKIERVATYIKEPLTGEECRTSMAYGPTGTQLTIEVSEAIDWTTFRHNEKFFTLNLPNSLVATALALNISDFAAKGLLVGPQFGVGPHNIDWMLHDGYYFLLDGLEVPNWDAVIGILAEKVSGDEDGRVDVDVRSRGDSLGQVIVEVDGNGLGLNFPHYLSYAVANRGLMIRMEQLMEIHAVQIQEGSDVQNREEMAEIHSDIRTLTLMADGSRAIADHDDMEEVNDALDEWDEENPTDSE